MLRPLPPGSAVGLDRPHKKCPCCGTVYTLSEWLDLKWVGPQHIEDEDGDALLILRDCPCGSTIATLYEEGRRAA